MNRKHLALLLTALLLSALCACGSPAPAETPLPTEAPVSTSAEAPASTEAPAQSADSGMQSVLPDAGLHEAEEKTEDPEIAERLAKAQELIGKSADELIAALGEPLERNYGPSCLGDGEDGELVYEGFSVFTYREGEKETVKDVE